MPTPVETLESKGLYRKLSFSLPAKPILDKVEKEIEEEAKTFKMAGFRDGKVPLPIVRKRIGERVLGKTIETVIDEELRGHFTENNIRPALQPSVEVKSFDDKSDLVFEAKLEIFPEVPEVTWDELEIEILDIEVTDEDLKKAHEDILKNFKNFEAAEDSYAAKKGDAVMIDFIGKVDGEEFEGGKGEGIRLELGSNQFIPGFEDQLIGVKKGDTKDVNVTFPADYTSKALAGKAATFEVKVNEVLTPEAVDNIDDEFAKKLGLESLEKLNEMIKQKIKADFEGVARLRTKKLLFDAIDGKYNFEVPEGMFKLDFEMMWNEIKKQHEKNPENFNKPLNELEDEYKKIAARRVRLGILLAETAKNNNINVEERDLQQAVYAEAMQRPGQEKLVIDFYSKKENLERLKGPLLEEKAVDFILTKVKTNKKMISSQEFFENYAKDLTAAN
ncbi:trigger factor [Holosporaceae bacterium 'Namur']|nr:trigger factor [Holosporaceae bacterium 'Namur']